MSKQTRKKKRYTKKKTKRFTKKNHLGKKKRRSNKKKFTKKKHLGKKKRRSKQRGGSRSAKRQKLNSHPVPVLPGAAAAAASLPPPPRTPMTLNKLMKATSTDVSRQVATAGCMNAMIEYCNIKLGAQPETTQTNVVENLCQIMFNKGFKGLNPKPSSGENGMTKIGRMVEVLRKGGGRVEIMDELITWVGLQKEVFVDSRQQPLWVEQWNKNKTKSWMAWRTGELRFLFNFPKGDSLSVYGVEKTMEAIDRIQSCSDYNSSVINVENTEYYRRGQEAFQNGISTDANAKEVERIHKCIHLNPAVLKGVVVEQQQIKKENEIAKSQWQDIKTNGHQQFWNPILNPNQSPLNGIYMFRNVQRVTCAYCWICTKSIDMYKGRLYKGNGNDWVLDINFTNIFFFITGACGEDEHVFAPGFGTLLTCSLASNAGGDAADVTQEHLNANNLLFLRGLRPSHAFCNVTKQDTNFVAPPLTGRGGQGLYIDTNAVNNYVENLLRRSSPNIKDIYHYVNNLLDEKSSQDGTMRINGDITQYIDASKMLKDPKKNDGWFHKSMDNCFNFNDVTDQNSERSDFFTTVRANLNDYLTDFCKRWNDIESPTRGVVAGNITYTMCQCRLLWNGCVFIAKNIIANNALDYPIWTNDHDEQEEMIIEELDEQASAGGGATGRFGRLLIVAILSTAAVVVVVIVVIIVVFVVIVAAGGYPLYSCNLIPKFSISCLTY